MKAEKALISLNNALNFYFNYSQEGSRDRIVLKIEDRMIDVYIDKKYFAAITEGDLTPESVGLLAYVLYRTVMLVEG